MEIISLESIFGLDFLPRGVVTRRPLENFVYIILIMENHGQFLKNEKDKNLMILTK